ncbi:MAG: tetratricopeptide repeat protein [Bacteroidales bacterium]|nr:tetratricopeptide repeat protein [Bacteroidales bacterium]
MKKVIPFFLLLLIAASCSHTKQLASQKNTDGHQTGVVPVSASVREIQQTSQYIDATTQKILGNSTKAQTLFEKCVKDNPSNDAAWYQLSIIYMNNLDMHGAESAAETAYNLDKDNEYYIQNLANIYSHNYKNDKAAALYEEIVKKRPEDIDAQVNYANALLQTTQYDKTLKQLDYLKTIVGPDPDLSMKKVAIYESQKKYDKACKEMTELVEIYPDSPQYLSKLADLYNKDGKEKEAVKCYQEIEEKYPDDAYIHFTLAEYYKSKGKDRDAHKELLKAFASPKMDANTKINVLLDNYSSEEIFSGKNNDVKELLVTLSDTHPDDGRSQSLMGDYYYLCQNLGMARQYYYKAVSLWKNPPLFMNLLQIESQLNRMDSVYSVASRALELYPMMPEFYYYKGMAEYQKNDIESAVKTFNDGLMMVVNNDDLKSTFFTLLGDCYHELGEQDKSFSSYDNALALRPDNLYVMNNYSYFLSTSNTNIEKAEALGKIIVEAEPENSHYLDTYGWALFKNGKYNEALKYLNEALKYSSGDDKAAIYEHIGDVKWKLNDAESALKYWQNAYNQDAVNASEILKKKINDEKYYEE